MAGMLPGVECARRRRFHQSSSDSPSTAAKLGSTRRPSFCLYTSNRDFHLTSSSSSSSKQRSSSNQAYQNDKLGEVAREAKERLDERLKTHRKPEISRKKSEEAELKRSSKDRGEKEKMKGKLEETKTKKKLFSWGKLTKWKASEQEECTICLEWFRAGEPLVHLLCAHKFHSTCLVPWLQANDHCPCCRFPISSQ